MESHFAHTKNEDVACRLGVSLRTAVRLAREMGLEKSEAFRREMQRNATEHSARVNRGEGNSGKVNLQIYGAAYRFKPGQGGNKRFMSPEAFKEMHRRNGVIRRETVRAERRRLAFGLEQKTALRVVQAPKCKTALRYNLRKHGYEVERASNDATITPATRRSELMERRAEKMGMRFYFEGEGL